jgi:hypothetical protein
VLSDVAFAGPLLEPTVASEVNSRCSARDFVTVQVDASGKKWFKCTLCAYSNNRFFNFNRHFESHLGVKEQCDICGGYFRWLKIHRAGCRLSARM